MSKFQVGDKIKRTDNNCPAWRRQAINRGYSKDGDWVFTVGEYIVEKSFYLQEIKYDAYEPLWELYASPVKIEDLF